MGFNYNPKDATNLIPDGEYDAIVTIADEQESKAGNAMLKLSVKVWHGGRESIVFDYIVVPATVWKLKQLLSALGMSERFEAGSVVPKDLVGKTIRVFVKTREDKTGKYSDQNVITKYMASTGDAHHDDDMPNF